MAPSTTPEPESETTLLNSGQTLETVSSSLATESNTALGSKVGTTPSRFRSMSHLNWEDIKTMRQELDMTQEMLLARLAPAELEWRQGSASCKELLRVRHLMDLAVWEPLFITELQRKQTHDTIRLHTRKELVKLMKERKRLADAEQNYVRNAIMNASSAALKAFPIKPEEA